MLSYYYEERPKQSPTLFDVAGESEHTTDGVSDLILKRARQQYGPREDIFYYVYGPCIARPIALPLLMI